MIKQQILYTLVYQNVGVVTYFLTYNINSMTKKVF